MDITVGRQAKILLLRAFKNIQLCDSWPGNKTTL
jgi:hypothetical protein